MANQEEAETIQTDNFDAAMEDVESKDGLAGKSWEDLTPLEFVKDYLEPLFDSFRQDLDEHMEKLTDQEFLEGLAKMGYELAFTHAGFAMKMGQEAGMVDENGEPTAKMPKSIRTMHEKCKADLAEFREVFEERFAEGDDNGSAPQR